MAASGFAAARLLIKLGAEVTLYDAKVEETFDLGDLKDRCERLFACDPMERMKDMDMLVLSPGVPTALPFIKKAVELKKDVISEIELGYRASKADFVCISGTNGKTTTTSLTDYLLKAAGEASVAVGNIGEPPVNEIDGRAHNEWFVAELSSYQIATTAELHPRVAVLLNITPDHLGWHKSHKNYALAKIKLFENMVDDDLVVIDVEDAGIHEFDEYIYTPGRRICKVAFDEPEGEDAAFVRDGKMVVRLKGVETQLVATSELKISGHHNVINALCAATAALAVGADSEGICRGLASFQPLEHRVEPCGEIDGVRYVNDSKATNTDAVEKALTAFPDDDVILLLGGHDKGTPLADFARVVMDNVRSVVCFGDARERFTAAMDNDINTSLAITALYDVLKADTTPATKLALIADFDKVLSLSLIEKAKAVNEKPADTAEELPAEILELAEQRKQARKDKNFALADELRDKITAMGYTVEETRQGTVIKKK